MARKVWGGLFTALVMTATSIVVDVGSAASRYRVRGERVTQGVILKKILDRRGPNRIRVLTVDPSTRRTFDVALGTEELPGHETTLSMARRHDAVAAINGEISRSFRAPGGRDGRSTRSSKTGI